LTERTISFKYTLFQLHLTAIIIKDQENQEELAMNGKSAAGLQ
jgi:hypothetical protein